MGFNSAHRELIYGSWAVEGREDSAHVTEKLWFKAWSTFLFIYTSWNEIFRSAGEGRRLMHSQQTEKAKKKKKSKLEIYVPDPCRQNQPHM